VDIVKLLLQKGASVTAKAKYGETPLHCAVRAGAIEIAELLIDWGADVNAQRRDGETPLHRAARLKGGLYISFHST